MLVVDIITIALDFVVTGAHVTRDIRFDLLQSACDQGRRMSILKAQGPRFVSP
jgi:hypothetical protein